jgi:hypothetical protein
MYMYARFQDIIVETNQSPGLRHCEGSLVDTGISKKIVASSFRTTEFCLTSASACIYIHNLEG